MDVQQQDLVVRQPLFLEIFSLLFTNTYKVIIMYAHVKMKVINASKTNSHLFTFCKLRIGYLVLPLLLLISLWLFLDFFYSIQTSFPLSLAFGLSESFVELFLENICIYKYALSGFSVCNCLLVFYKCIGFLSDTKALFLS